MSKHLLDGADLKLGLFSSNCSSGLAVTKVADRWQATWDDNLRLAQVADAAGIDFLLPIARWIGYGGDTNFHEGVLDPVALASAQLARTERLVVFATIHTAFNHPVVAAKAMATVDQIGRGRAGLNIVAGWNKPEYDAMGLDLPQGHDDRYAFAQEWWDVVRRLWTEDGRYDIDGRFWNLRGVESSPKPYDGLLPILNAGSSAQGRDFAARNSNVVFTIVAGPEDGAEVVSGVKRAAADQYGRQVGVFTPAHCVCRATRDEAEEFHRWYAEENADWDAVDNLMALQGLHAQSFTPEMLELFRGRFAAGHGTCPLIGSPDDVAAEIKRYHDAGFDGMTVSFVDYVGELEYFAAEVMPRLERMGVRRPRVTAG
jgi:alkanesulfonate monooxygenase SsuD/methylene tetrahydromethanopterin reductase-like flavin-dependent oxidoreductase (luciferase family)